MRRAQAYVVALAALGAALWLPALATAGSGGGGLQRSGAATSSGTATSEPQQVSGSAGGMTITTSSVGLLSHQIGFTGTVGSGNAGQTVEIERSGRETKYSWAGTAQGRVNGDGSFTVRWTANHIGQFAIRAVVQHGHGGGSTASAWPTVTMIVYRPSVATWYGPGSWGSTTACGVVLGRNTLGLANRTLPCGTKVALYYHGKTMVVPVIDRGPYGDADWDLTQAAAHDLGMESAGRVTLGAVSLPTRR
jgi:hypothetical protein